MDKKTWIIIGLVTLIVVFGVWQFDNSSLTGNVVNENINKPQQDTITCNSPYTKVGTSCCLDQNANNICDNDEVYATVDNFEGKLRWIELRDITASSKGTVPERCPNGKNQGDIWFEFRLKDLKYDAFYSCEIELIEGEDIHLYSGLHSYINKNNGYSIDRKVAFDQHLKEQHTVRICCSLTEEGQRVCKSFTLEPYC